MFEMHMENYIIVLIVTVRVDNSIINVIIKILVEVFIRKCQVLT